MHQTTAAHSALKPATRAAPTFVARVRAALFRLLADMAVRR